VNTLLHRVVPWYVERLWNNCPNDRRAELRVSVWGWFRTVRNREVPFLCLSVESILTPYIGNYR
jgi:hypothetical protein